MKKKRLHGIFLLEFITTQSDEFLKHQKVLNMLKGNGVKMQGPLYSSLSLSGHSQRPSLSGHSQQRPPSLMCPQIFGTTTVNAIVLIPLTKGHLSNVAKISWQIGVALLEGDYILTVL